MAFSQYRQDAADAADSVGFYLLTDGKPDTSMSLVMKTVTEMNAGKNVVINTISFNCPDRYLNFLMMFELSLNSVHCSYGGK